MLGADWRLLREEDSLYVREDNERISAGQNLTPPGASRSGYRRNTAVFTLAGWKVIKSLSVNIKTNEANQSEDGKQVSQSETSEEATASSGSIHGSTESEWGSLKTFTRTAAASFSSPGSGVGLIPLLLPRREDGVSQASKAKASLKANSPSSKSLSFYLSFYIGSITGDYRNLSLIHI